jgi:hypothetical protein
MIFPEAIATIKKCWKRVEYAGESIGNIRHAKERLIRDLRPANPQERSRCRDYRETDGVLIAQSVRRLNLVTEERVLKSGALFQFRSRLLSELEGDDFS